MAMYGIFPGYVNVYRRICRKESLTVVTAHIPPKQKDQAYATAIRTSLTCRPETWRPETEQVIVTEEQCNVDVFS